MRKRIRLVVVVGFLFLPITGAYAQSLEVLTPQVKPGGLVVVKILSFQVDNETGLLIFETIYQPNKDGFVFVGVPLSTKPDSYIMYLVNRFSEERIDWGYQELKVVPTQIKVRPSDGVTKPSRRRKKETSAIAAAYQKANHTEFYAEKSFRTPLLKMFITSDFAINHGGVDLRASFGTKVSTINSGRVIMTAKKFSLEGNMVIIDHGSGIFSYYLHLSRIKVREGQMVNVGQVVGLSGATGDVHGPHLHLAVKVNGTNIDPLAFINGFDGDMNR